STTALGSIDDAFIQGGTSSANTYGLEPLLLSKAHKTSDFTRQSFVQFDLSSVAAIRSARLRVFGMLNSTSNTNVPVGVLASETFHEDTITFNNRPSTGAQLAKATISNTVPQWWVFDVTEYLRGEKAHGRDIVALSIQNLITSTAFAQFSSREGSDPPQVVISS
ncbi:MAG: DUF7594 domain-containing protein, partial [Tepidisphaeraceae bacterium]